ncbi:NAD(P)H-dependent oxidoreductase [Paenibacillus thiaminolyticus]|nr:NAD(P)H-dependent oxidoreductase [Paenibacillus thiaminolyticus]WCF09369.1 NAD(P)H-dependent oxidoreductase [Paenibacillus thiaminolyticus]
MRSNILVINGHPDPESFCAALSDAYLEGASAVNQLGSKLA